MILRMKQTLLTAMFSKYYEEFKVISVWPETEEQGYRDKYLRA